MTSLESLITNHKYFNGLLKLGRVLSRDAALRITIIPPPSSSSPSSPQPPPPPPPPLPPPPPPPPQSASSPSSSPRSSSTTRTSASVSVSAVKVDEFDSFDKCYVPDDEWSEDMYSAKDEVSQLWVIFYHLIEQRNETRVFGASYTTQKSLYEKVHALQSDFSHGTSVSIYLSSFYVLDDLCYRPTGDTATAVAANKVTSLVGVFDSLREICNAQHGILFEARQRQPDNQPPASSKNNADILNVDVEGRSYRVWEARLGCYKAELTKSTDTEALATREELVKLLQAIKKKRLVRPEKDQLDFSRTDIYKDTFVKEISVTDLLLYERQNSNQKAQSESSKTDDTTTCIKYYQSLAAMAWYATWHHAKTILPEVDVSASDALRFLYDFMGPDITSRIAAVGCSTVPQRGFKQISYSSFKQTPNDDNSLNRVSLPISAAALRDVGRLSVADNVIKPPVMTSLDPLIAVEDQTSDSMVAAKFSSELVSKGEIVDQKKIC